jgi:hypothetical protein
MRHSKLSIQNSTFAGVLFVVLLMAGCATSAGFRQAQDSTPAALASSTSPPSMFYLECCHN